MVGTYRLAIEFHETCEATASVAAAPHFGVSDGSFFDNTGDYTITITQIAMPEPVSLALLGTGLIGIAATRYRARQLRSGRSTPTLA